jgi:hypothetical protein
MTTLPISKIWTWAQVAVCCAAVWILLDVTRYYAGRGTAWIVGLSLFFLAALALFRLRKKI